MYIVTILVVQSLLMLSLWTEVALSLLLGILLYIATLYLFELIDVREIKYYAKIVMKR